MARRFALRSEILDSLDQARTKDHLPITIDGDAARERMLTIDEPTREAEAV
jgi:hypothetical protein